MIFEGVKSQTVQTVQFIRLYINKQANVLPVLGGTASWIQEMVSIDQNEDPEFNQQGNRLFASVNFL